MSHKIKPTSAPVYWVAYDDDKTIVHSGVTNPGETTTIGMKNVVFGSKRKQTKELKKFANKKKSPFDAIDES